MQNNPFRINDEDENNPYRRNQIMPKIADLKISDNNGEEYTFEVHPIHPFGTQFKDIAGVYIFTKRDSNRKTHEILYVGETGSFRHRPLGWRHHKWPSATRRGITHVCILQTPNRKYIENQLKEAYKPPLNER